MKILIPKASTSVILTVFIQDGSATDGSGLGGLDQTSSIIGGYVKRDGTGVALSVNQNVTTEGTYEAPSTAAQVRIGTPANLPTGFYELHFHNDLFTTADWVTMGFSGASNMAPLTLEIQLTGVDLNDAVRGGMTSLPDAAAQAVGGLYTRGTGAGQINQPANGAIDVNAVSAVAAFFEDCFTVNSGKVSGNEVSGSLILEIVRVAWDRVLTGATHNIATSAGRRLRGIQAFGDYANGALWFDSVNGTGGQVAYENATVQNPSNSITDILALASSLNMVRIEVAPGSTLTLNATLAGFSVMGVNWTLVFNGKDVSGSLFSGAQVSGVGTGANEIGFHHCHFANATLPPSDLQWCVLEGTFTIGTAGNFFFENCESGIAGATTPILDFGGALNSSNANFRNYSGGLEIQNMGAGTGTYRLSFDCPAGQIVFNANCSATSEIELRGNHRLTNNASGLTINDDARIDVGQINTQVDAALVDIKLDHLIAVADGDDPVNGSIIAHMVSATEDWSTFVPSDDSLQAIRDNTEWDTATGFSTHTAAGVWAIDATGQQTQGSFGQAIGDPGVTAKSLWQAVVSDAAGASVSADVIAVKTDTGNLVSRITSALFNGITSMAQWLGLFGGKQTGNATARTELRATGAGSGAYDETTDSQEAIRGAVDTITGGTGTGARTVAVTVNDGVAVLENAIVRFTEGANTYAGPTNASGQLSFSLDDATYDVAVSKVGYTFTPTTLVVDGDKTPTYSMTVVTITAPPNASTTTGIMTVYDEQGSVEEGVTMTVQIQSGPGTDGIGYDSTEWAELSSALGVVEFAGIILGAKYQIWRGTTKANVQKFTAPTAGDSFDLAEVIGRG